MHAIAHGGCADTCKRVCTESWLWEKMPLPHQRIEPASAAWRSDAVTNQATAPPLHILLLLYFSVASFLHFPLVLYVSFLPFSSPFLHFILSHHYFIPSFLCSFLWQRLTSLSDSTVESSARLMQASVQYWTGVSPLYSLFMFMSCFCLGRKGSLQMFILVFMSLLSGLTSMFVEKLEW